MLLDIHNPSALHTIHTLSHSIELSKTGEGGTGILQSPMQVPQGIIDQGYIAVASQLVSIVGQGPYPCLRSILHHLPHCIPQLVHLPMQTTLYLLQPACREEPPLTVMPAISESNWSTNKRNVDLVLQSAGHENQTLPLAGY